ncbi:MAG: DUF962 domain-containing protein [Gammaproteobacteria bacterium]|nr:DUF962 domain-containing protein [Gammaproteobacteria bacterium]NNC97437.1 DUF962 domain-containing protein [Gammaproteobacteria bacterium]NNM13910.1 DUF962 domain-containing protein [Gammaproteobacteria bacterium]
MASKFNSFKEFYPYYLSEHQNLACRRLHFVGTGLVLGLALYFTLAGKWNYWWALLLCGYGFAWVGHFFFEKNRPATFKNPFYSLLGDFVMFKDIVIGKIKL